VTAGTQVVRAYRVPNTPNGLDGSTSMGVTVDGFADCSLSGTGKLCLDLAHYAAFPTAPTHDVVIGIDKANAAVMVDPWATTVSATQLTSLTSAVPMKTTVRSVETGDFNGDGNPELIAAFAPTADDSNGAVLVCTMATNGITSACQDVVPAILTAAAAGGPAVKSCFDAAPAHISYSDPTVTPNPAVDLVVACRGDGTSIFRVHQGASLVVDRLANTGEAITAVRAGDVTGDHVDDVLLLAGETVTSLIVYPQCTSRDAATCHTTTTGESP
jgi:hypothetical protein